MWISVQTHGCETGKSESRDVKKQLPSELGKDLA